MKKNNKTVSGNRRPKRYGSNSESGIVLVMCVVMIGALCFIAGTTFVTLRPEIKGARYFRNERRAFYNAEAGVQYLVDSISRDLSAGALALTGEVESVSYTAPTGYEFDTITEITPLADAVTYTAVVTGRHMNSRAIIEVGFQRPLLLASGAFGNVDLQLQPNIELYSYDSRVTSSPTAANSTGKANAGSNKNITVRPGVVLDGVFVLGEDEFGYPASPISGYENQSIGRIDPDPLGADAGALDDAATYYSDPVHNDNSSVGITNNLLSIGSGETVTLTGGHYYFEDIAISSGGTLNIDGSTVDPIVIFLNGPMESKPNSAIITSTGAPTELFIFSTSNQDVKLYPNNNFEGMIYAPEAYLDIHPNNTARGVFFAKDLLILPGAESFIDTATLGTFRAPYVEIVQWRHVID